MQREESQSCMIDDDYDLGIENGRRESNVCNDDDYDYALELFGDEEYRLTAQAMQEVKDFPDEITGKTYSPVRPAAEENKGGSVFSNLVAYGKKRLSMATGAYPPKSPDAEAKAISHKDFLPPTPEEDKRKRRRSSLSSIFSKKSNSPAMHTPSPVSARLNRMEMGIEEEKEESDEEMKDMEGIRLALDEEDDEPLGESEIEEGDDDVFNSEPEEGWNSAAANSDKNLTKKEYKSQLKLLNKRRRWAETAVRRTSEHFMDNFDSSGKAAMDKFIVAMSRGILVRRHQAGCVAEEVRLFSDNGCHTINWEPPKKDKDAPVVDSTPIIPGIGGPVFDGSAFDCCITVCGCGDNLQDSHDLSHINNRDSYKANLGAGGSADGNGEGKRNGLWGSIRYHRHGLFEDSSMVAIQPATRDDPTRPGYIGTHSFRNSKDSYNQALSFSVVTSFALGGVSTLDIECQTEEEYFMLLSGFLMLCTEAHFRHARDKKEKKKAKLERADSKLSKTWENYQTSLFPPEVKKMDAIESLFYVSSGLMLPLKFNMEMKPGQEKRKRDYDVIPPSQFLGWKSAGTQIWARLRLAGLDVKCVFSWDLRRVILKVKCPQWRLEEVAEKMHMKLKKRDGTFKRFKRSRRGTFVAAGFNGAIFRSSERQRIIDFILRTKIVDGGAELDEDTKLGQSIKSRYPLHMHERLDMLKHSWVTFWKIEQPGEIATPWSVLDVPFMVTVRRIWTSANWTWEGLLSQPLDSIAEYYGEDVAFYFAWMSFFSRWLVLPSILGVIVFCVQVRSRQLDHWLCIPYAIVIIMWSCVLLAFWRQKAATLAHRWGVLDYEVEETERPQFRGKYAFDASLGEVRKLYPSWKRFLKYCVSYPVILFFVGSVLILMIVTSTTNEQLSKQFDDGDQLNYSPRIRESFGMASSAGDPKDNEVPSDQTADDDNANTLSSLANINYWVVNLIYPSVYGLITNVAAELFEKLAIALTDFENHQTESSYWNQLIIKVFSVRFVTVFTSIFYYAFRSGLSSEKSYRLMSLSIFAFITIGDWWGKFIQICVPSWIQRFQLYRMKAAVVTLRKYIWKLRAQETGGENGLYMMARRQNYLTQSQEQCWVEALQKDYTTFGDYTRLMIQLGFVLFFAAVFPLSPLIVLINNIFFIRLDAFKLTNTRKRPIAQKSAGLGVWEDILQVMSVAGIITNCCLVGITSSVLPRWMRAYGTVGVAIVLFFFEHIMLLFKYMLHKAIPKIPVSVQREIIGIRPNGSGGKAKAETTKKKKRPKFVKEFNLHDDDDDHANALLIEENAAAAAQLAATPVVVDDTVLHDENAVHLFLGEEAIVTEERLSATRRGSSYVRSIADDLCSELSEEIDNHYRDNRAHSIAGSARNSEASASAHNICHTTSHVFPNRAMPPPRGGLGGGGRRRSSIRKLPVNTAMSTKAALAKSPMPRRSAVLYKHQKSHPLARESEESVSADSDSSSNSSNGDVSVTRLKMKIQALQRKGKHIKAREGPTTEYVSRMRSQSTNEDMDNAHQYSGEEESPTSRARRRIAQSSRIPFTAYPAHAIVTKSQKTGINYRSDSEASNQQAVPARKHSSIIGRQFLSHSSRSASHESQEEDAGSLVKPSTSTGNVRPAAVELATRSPTRPKTAEEEQRDRLSISNLPSEEREPKPERSKSIASSAWDFMRGKGFSSNRPSLSEKITQPVESIQMDARGSPLRNHHMQAQQYEQQNQGPIEEEKLPTYDESQNMALVRRGSPQQSSPPVGQRRSPAMQMRSPSPKKEQPPTGSASRRAPSIASETSPTLSAIQNRGTVRSVASAINGKSPAPSATMKQQRQAEAYQAHIERTRPLTASSSRTPLASKAHFPPPHSSSPMPKMTPKRTPNPENNRNLSNNKEIGATAGSVERSKEKTLPRQNDWEALPESACFIGRLKDQSSNRRQSTAASPFMKILQGSDCDEQYEESPESQDTVPKAKKRESFGSPLAGGTHRLEYNDDAYEPSPPERDLERYHQVIGQYSEDYDDEYEESPVSDRGGRKSIMREQSLRRDHDECYGGGYGEADDAYEHSPPSPPHRSNTRSHRRASQQHYTSPSRRESSNALQRLRRDNVLMR